jgi:hypothetical protein
VKIRNDFITNSSSTNFVIICKDKLIEEDFKKLIGVHKDSPFRFAFDELYETLAQKMKPAREYYNSSYMRGSYESFDLFLENEFSKQVRDKVLEAEKKGKNIFIGRLSSDETEIQTFFCCDSFEIENDSIYLNALECVW